MSSRQTIEEHADLLHGEVLVISELQFTELCKGALSLNGIQQQNILQRLKGAALRRYPDLHVPCGPDCCRL